MSNNLLAGVRAVIFDMDGLMLDTERMAQSAWQTAGAERNYDFPAHVYLQAVGRTKSDTERLFKDAFGPEFPFDALYARKQELFYAMLEAEPIPTKPGLFELLDRIDGRGWPKRWPPPRPAHWRSKS
ncbi:MAG: HAD family phosphatase [Caldilineaceae bacterium]